MRRVLVALVWVAIVFDAAVGMWWASVAMFAMLMMMRATRAR